MAKIKRETIRAFGNDASKVERLVTEMGHTIGDGDSIRVSPGDVATLVDNDGLNRTVLILPKGTYEHTRNRPESGMLSFVPMTGPRAGYVDAFDGWQLPLPLTRLSYLGKGVAGYKE